MTGVEAIILAGGLGTRLRGVVADLPKPMAPVGGVPFLEYLIRQLRCWGVQAVVLSVGYRHEVIQGYFGDGARLGLRVRYSVEEEPLGTGGAIREAAGLLSGESFLVLNGDSYLDLDFDCFHQLHRDRAADLTLALLPRDDTGRYGRVAVDATGRVLRFEEKRGNEAGLINGGIYLLRRNCLFLLPPAGKASFEEAVLSQCGGLTMYGMPCPGFFVDIGTPEDYRALCNDPGRLA